VKWTRLFVSLLILFAISANTTVAFSSSFEVFNNQNKESKSPKAPHFQQLNDNLIFFIEEDFLEEVEEEFDPQQELPTFVCTNVGTPTYLLRFLAAHRLKEEACFEQTVNVNKNPLFIVYQVFRI
jgi:hypothetical protein